MVLIPDIQNYNVEWSNKILHHVNSKTFAFEIETRMILPST